jgi:predicted DCC family thiol-disulfide oxidoreductase YuxK
MPDERPIEVFYNSACPVCDAGVDEQRRAMWKRSAAQPVFTDMSSAPTALAGENLTLDHVRRHLYARDSAGRLHRGADAIALLWRATPGRRWLGHFISLPGIRLVARVGYDWFADRLYAWNRRHGRW